MHATKELTDDVPEVDESAASMEVAASEHKDEPALSGPVTVEQEVLEETTLDTGTHEVAEIASSDIVEVCCHHSS